MRTAGGRSGGGSCSTLGQRERLAFSGVHVISPRLIAKYDRRWRFLDYHFLFAARWPREKKFSGFGADEYYWRDLGRPENVAQAARDVEQQILECDAQARWAVVLFAALRPADFPLAAGLPASIPSLHPGNHYDQLSTPN